MTRILLITPYGFQNQGVRLLSALLRREGFDAPVLFMKGWVNNDIRPPTQEELDLFDQCVTRLAPQIVGFGFGTPYLKTVIELTKRVRRLSDAHVIWGGVHPTIVPEDCIDHADSVCVGEGEHPLVDLAHAIRERSSPARIRNLWAREDGRLVRNPLRPLIQDLDALPHTSLLHAEAFTIEGGRLSRGDPLQSSAIYRIFASRGCPFRCTYCYNNQFRAIFQGLGPYHRTRRVEGVIEELEGAKSKLPRMRRVRFDDDTFLFPQSWIDAFVRDYPGRVGLPFDILVNPEVFRAPTLRALKGAGLCALQAGIQSASAKELTECYDRKGATAKVVELARTARDLDIEVTFDVILDNPLSTDRDKEATVDLLLELPRPFHLFLYSLTHFPRSALTERLLKTGKITKDDVEGRATKSFRQFRLSLDYPRPAEDTVHACLVSLTSKSFVPRTLIRWLRGRRGLSRHTAGLRLFAEAVNAVKLGGMAVAMWRRGELSPFKLREYATPKRRLIQ